MINLKDLTFDLNLYPDNIALLFSGGSDSTLLLYLILLDTKNINKDLDLSIYVLDRFNKPLHHANNIINLISKKFNKQLNLINLKIPKISQQHEILLASKILESRHDAILWAINKYPSDESIRPKYLFDFVERGKIKLPFANLEKDKLINLFYELGIEDILNQTHSCGSNLEQPCQVCFNCRERSWAYKSLGLEENLGV